MEADDGSAGNVEADDGSAGNVVDALGFGEVGSGDLATGGGAGISRGAVWGKGDIGKGDADALGCWGGTTGGCNVGNP